MMIRKMGHFSFGSCKCHNCKEQALEYPHIIGVYRDHIRVGNVHICASCGWKGDIGRGYSVYRDIDEFNKSFLEFVDICNSFQSSPPTTAMEEDRDG